MDGILEKAVNSVLDSEMAYCKFITVNDTNKKSHQSGFLLHVNAWNMFFDEKPPKGQITERFATIAWPDGTETNSRFIYYSSKNEFRLTRFGRGFAFLDEENLGSLLILTRRDREFYNAFILSSDTDIDTFFSEVNISIMDAGKIIPKPGILSAEQRLIDCFNLFIQEIGKSFPATADMSARARYCYNRVKGITTADILKNCDKELMGWIECEYQLFKAVEYNFHADDIVDPFESLDDLVKLANTILNRRKSRAGKSLEHHLAEIFDTYQLKYDNQAKIEGNKRPDFLFPGAEAYVDEKFDSKKLIMLASKTTCKDRWRQILSEADKIPIKHLFTLQESITKNQLEEMSKARVKLVVPRTNIRKFPAEYQDQIISLKTFVEQTAALQQ